MYRVVTFILAIIIISCSGCREDDGLFVISEQEINSGGANFTTFNFGENAFGVQGNELSRDESRFFSTGNSLFRSNWVAAPASVTSLDGVGPLLNARSCGSCHFKDGRAAPPDDPNANNAGILWRISVEGTSDVGGPKPHPVYGEQIQDQSLPSAAPEGKVITTYEEISGNYADGTPYTLIKPVFQLSELAYGEIEEA
ncbi:MAG: di-heme oxidoredictase family protein, partial [Bacteroidota bacterium]